MIGHLRFTRAAALAGLFFPAVLAACGGKGVSIGSNSGELKTVDPTTVAGTVNACAPQAAHPNVCCKGGPNEASDCVAFVNSPFHKCDDGWTTYPDPNNCCDLTDPTKCAPPPPNPPPPPSCGYACAPGWWPVVNQPGECCHILASGNALECSQVAWGYPEPQPAVCVGGGGTGGGSADGGVPIPPVAVDAGPPPSIDGGAPPPVADASVPPSPVPDPNPTPVPIDCDAGVPPVPAPPPWPGPVCNAPCPAGFSPLPADPTICCAPEPQGGEICFSQAGGPAGGPGGVVFGSGGKGTTGSGSAGSTGSGSGSTGSGSTTGK